jgi:diadenosine tetraphosphate (Ap4A) HIT family hydrolase
VPDPVVPSPCPECAAASGGSPPAGGLLVETARFVVHALIGATPVPGWVVVAPKRHVEALGELSPDEHREWMALATRLAAAQQRALGSKTSYLALFAEVVPHLHLHVIPRFDATPGHLRGPRVFQALPAEMLPAAEVERAIERLRGELATS